MAFTPQTINKELDMANLAKHNANYSAIKTELDAHDTHIAAQTAHGSTSALTAGKIMQRDSAGRAKVAAPSAPDDIARKAEVDTVQAGLDAHEADSVSHLTSAEHTKLTGIEEGAEVNQNAFAQVNNVAAGAESDTLTIAGGTGITVSTNPTTKTVTVTATGEATPGAHGSSHNNDGADPIPDLVTLRDDFDALTPANIGAETPAGAQEKVSALGLEVSKLGNYRTGTEYLYFYHEKLRTKQPVKVIFSGDSTTDGVSITDPDFLLHNLAKETMTRRGVKRATAVNAGHSNMRTTDWQNQYLAEDLAESPDLYILRWGLNDGAYTPKSERLGIFTDALRGGLADLRAAVSADQMSVVLMMPNSTNDPTNGRDAEWFEEIYPVVKQAARDYQCCFVDTYHYLLDSTNVTWQDEPMGEDGVHVHPLNTGNAWIVSILEDALVPPALCDFGIHAPISTDKVCFASELPSSFPDGVSMYRTAGTWPFDGFVTTYTSTDGILLQWNSGLYAQSYESIAVRRGLRISGIPGAIGDDAWAPWIYVSSSENAAPLLLENGLVVRENFGTPTYARLSSGTVKLSGCFVASTSLPVNTVIAWLPVGRRPANSASFVVASEKGYAAIDVWNDGSIRLMQNAGAGWFSLDNISFQL